ncbi:MAG: hypothetical protein RJQ07_08770 [Pseudomonadales bacterium]
MTTSCRAACLLLLASCVFACGAGRAADGLATTPVAAADVEVLPLPAVLAEVSGLTMLADGTLLAIGDERGQVYAVDFAAGVIVPKVSFGTKSVHADFEGLTVAEGRIYALTSNGVIYHRSLDPGDDEFTRVKTGLGKHCEFEGLAADPTTPVLWLLCKTPLDKKLKKRLTLFAWDRVANEVRVEQSLTPKLKRLGLPGKLAPSGLALSADGQTFFLVAARQQAFVFLSRTGELKRAGRLPGSQPHPQAEGALWVGETLFVADEGVGGPATITRYKHGF